MPEPMPSDLCFDYSELGTESAVQKFEQAGCLQVANFLPSGKVDVLASELALAISDPAAINESIAVGQDRRMYSIPVAGAFNDADLYAPPALRLFLSQTLGQDFLMSCLTCVVANASAPAQHDHQDSNGLFAAPIDSFTPSFAINLFVPLVPLNSTNGTTRIWPYSHRKPSLQTDEHAEDYICPELDVGSALLLDYRVKHSGTANLSANYRPLLCLAYSRDWFIDNRHFNEINPLQIEQSALNEMEQDDRHLFSRASLYRNRAVQ